MSLMQHRKRGYLNGVGAGRGQGRAQQGGKGIGADVVAGVCVCCSFARIGFRENKLDTGGDRMSQRMRRSQKVRTDCRS